MRLKTFAVATPLSIAAWFGIYQLAAAGLHLISLPAVAAPLQASLALTRLVR